MNLSALLKIADSKERVNVERFRVICQNTYTPSGQKYFNIVKYTYTNCAINRLNIELQHKMVIDI